MRWAKQQQYVTTVRKGRLNLGLAITKHFISKQWFAVALTTPKSGLEIFDDHSHDVIGTFRTRREAMAACERYAATWLKKRKRTPRCDCSEIDT